MERSVGRRICVVGSGTLFLSGVSYYTNRLATALAEVHEVTVVLMRRLLPVRLYPGKARVGTDLTRLAYPPSVRVCDGVDWFLIPSVLFATRAVVQARPGIVVFQWWTGTVLHAYLILATVARLVGAKLIVEFHEIQDTGELRIRAARAYVRLFAPLLMRLADGFVVHSSEDEREIAQRYGSERPIKVIPHGPFDHHARTVEVADARQAPESACNILFFGTIRPYKGLEDLIEAFGSLDRSEVQRYWLTVVGETWEGWTLPTELIQRSPHRDRITFVNHYVTDDDVDAYFAGADAVALPYHRSSASGPLHVAMSYGHPTIVTRVGGLVEAAADYEGVVFVPAREPSAIREAFGKVAALRGKKFPDPHSWSRTVARLDDLFREVEETSTLRP